MGNFLGAPYPIYKHPKGYFHNQDDISQIKSDLLILLLTNPGERVMLPNFGTPLRTLIFEPNNTNLQDRAKKMIIQAIKDWEPRVQIDQIEVSSTINSSFINNDEDLGDAGNVLSIKILFKEFSNITEVQELVLQVPLGI